ncbi:glycosyltransferase family 2 protein [Gammaproteobacteria bacterium]|nr:glycosyltransferase family 2 protein [Gammaproteobacteria bacterium]
MFSIIVPTYNSEKTVYNTILSILNQDYYDFELIVVDNNSLDSTKLIVESFKDTRISFHLIDNKGMPAISRNYGISIAKFDFIAFCDSDDTWEHNKLSMCLGYIEKGFNFIAHDVKLIGSTFKSVVNKIFDRRPAQNFSDFVLKGNNIIQSSVVLKRSILVDLNGYTIDPRFIAVEDAHLWARVLQSQTKLCFIKKCLGSYSYSPLALSFSANQFIGNRSLRLEYFINSKPCWYKYNIATYLWRRKMYLRSSIYIKSIFFTPNCPFELRLKSAFLLVRLWFH